MSIISHNALPASERLHEEGLDVLTPKQAVHQDIHELHVGILNMMPDAALKATECQFLRLLGMSNSIVQFRVHLFTSPEIVRGEKATAHIAQFYETFEDVRTCGLDALIITGASPTHTLDTFFTDVLVWVYENKCPVLASCFAAHAILKALYGIERSPLSRKMWGVYQHRVVDRTHPLVQNINTRFDAPHSRENEVSAEQFRDAGLRVLAESSDAGLHIGTSPDGFQFIFVQGHPEYDLVSILKELKREVAQYFQGERSEYPPLPENVFHGKALSILYAYQERVMFAGNNGRSLPTFPEERLLDLIDNTWVDTAKALFSNWIGVVYQSTSFGRAKRF